MHDHKIYQYIKILNLRGSITSTRGGKSHHFTDGEQKLGLRVHPRKSLGQHFLRDSIVVENIIHAAELSPSDVIIEVGPGKGILTRGLAQQHCRVIAVEVDSNLAILLRKAFIDYPDVSIVQADILQTDIAALLSNICGTVLPYKMVANIPYYITSPILRYFLEGTVKPELMVVMVQKEVGEAITAQPGQMSPLSVGIQYYGEPIIIGAVPAESFYPRPKVDSVILKIKPYPYPPVSVTDEEKFFHIVRAGFSAPRKQLRNSLAYGLHITPSTAEALLEKAGISPRRRAETLSISEWHNIYTYTVT